MKLKHGIQNFILFTLFTTGRVRSQECTGDFSSSYPNCTAANTAFCSGDIIFRCFYPYGHACPGNCMDNLDEQYRDVICWESYPGAGDGQCTAECVSVTAKNGSTLYPLGCAQNGTSTTASTPLSTTTSTSSDSATTTSVAATTTTPVVSPTSKANAGCLPRRPMYQETLTSTGVIALVAYVLYS